MHPLQSVCRILRSSTTIVSLLTVSAVFAPACGGDSGSTPTTEPEETGPALTPDEKAALQQEIGNAGGKADGFGVVLFRSSYVNMALSAKADRGDVAFVAGSHSKDFPYWQTEPWDNGLLYVGGEGYHFTQRTRGQALKFDVDTKAASSSGHMRYQGEMVRAADGQSVSVTLDFQVDLKRLAARQLGKQYNFLDIKEIPGMKWTPFWIQGSTGSITIGTDKPIAIQGIRGGLETGDYTNLRAPEFAVVYDYVSLARPGDGGYSFVDFVTHPLRPNSVLGKVLEWYGVNFGSGSLTMQDGSEKPGNTHKVVRPAQSDASVLLFESSVDIGLANLRRQLVKTHDADGATLYGLREIFEPK